MSDAGTAARDDTRPPLVERLSGFIAMVGGLLSLGIAALVVVSVVGRKFYNSPVNGDFEMVQMGTAMTVFSFLAYCQARRGNIVVDTFMTWLPRRAIDIVDAVWDIAYAGMMGLIAYCMTFGVIEHYRSGQTTMLLQLIVWPALAICTALAALVAVVALATAAQLIFKGRP
jgi:TRAP-type C4-dicarboxylate transport system permease small subunit